MNIYQILSSRPHNLHYLNRYIKFINSITLQSRTIGKTHHHHICPKSLDCFPQYKNLKQHPWNGIHLTYRQHVIAHWMLAKMYGGSMSSALFLMKIKDKNGQYKISSKMYEQVKLEHSTRVSLMNSKRKGKPCKASGPRGPQKNPRDKSLPDMRGKATGSTSQRGVIRGPHKNPRPPYKKELCPHCNLWISSNTIDRWHNDNCKEKVNPSSGSGFYEFPTAQLQ